MTMTKVAEYATPSVTIEAIVADKPLAEKTPITQVTYNYLGLLVTRDRGTGEIIDQQEFFNTDRAALIERMKEVVRKEEREDEILVNAYCKECE